MPLLVTGSTGSIGSALIERMAPRHRLRLLVRPGKKSRARERLAESLGSIGREALGQGRIEVYEGDIARPHLGLGPADRRRISEGLSGIAHLAARTDFHGTKIADYAPANVEGARRIAALAAAGGSPLLCVSTAYVCGAHEGLFGERDTGAGKHHHNAYERSKHEAEAVVREQADRYGFPLTIVRPGIVLPMTPRHGAEPGPGPLVHLRLLASLRGTPHGTPRIVRHAANPKGLLNLVPQQFVVRVLDAALARSEPGAIKTYHATAARSFQLDEVVAIMNDCLPGLQVRLVNSRQTVNLDRYERLFARRCRPYASYLDLRVRFDRSALLSDLGEIHDGADPEWLRDLFSNHLSAWRAAPMDSRAEPKILAKVHAYFGRFLKEKLRRRLLPDLRTLQAYFTITVPGAGIYRIRIEEGYLTEVSATRGPQPEFDYEVEALDFLAVAAARARPSELFFDQRVHVRGDLVRALSTATALEEFFRLFPYGSPDTLEASS